MESLTRLVSESLARHGFDRPLDYRRLRWSRWFRCESHHSLLFVPSKPGVFAVAEEIMDLGGSNTYVGAGDSPAQRREASAPGLNRVSDRVWPSNARLPLSVTASTNSEEHEFSCAERAAEKSAASVAEGVTDGENRAASIRRMLAVTQFFEDDDMAFVLDRMLSRQNPMAACLASGRYFVRFVVIEDQIQRRSICNALNQWIVSAAEKATGIGSHFASSLELTPATEFVPPTNNAQPSLFADAETNENENVGRTLPLASSGQALSANADTTDTHVARTRPEREPKGPSPASASAINAKVGQTFPSASSDPALSQSKGKAQSTAADTITNRPRATAPHLNSGAATNIHCPSPFPSGF